MATKTFGGTCHSHRYSCTAEPNIKYSEGVADEWRPPQKSIHATNAQFNSSKANITMQSGNSDNEKKKCCPLTSAIATHSKCTLLRSRSFDSRTCDVRQTDPLRVKCPWVLNKIICSRNIHLAWRQWFGKYSGRWLRFEHTQFGSLIAYRPRKPLSHYVLHCLGILYSTSTQRRWQMLYYYCDLFLAFVGCFFVSLT